MSSYRGSLEKDERALALATACRRRLIDAGLVGCRRDMLPLLVNEKIDTAWDLLLETRRDIRRVVRSQQGARRGPLKTGRHA